MIPISGLCDRVSFFILVDGGGSMASWVTHLMVADGLLEVFPELDRRGFCVGNIAPDCNRENADWTEFTPPREVTHWMRTGRKSASDCDDFRDAYIFMRGDSISSAEEYSFLLGYYAHLITDAAFQAMLRDNERVNAAWARVKADAALSGVCAGMEATWDSIKKIIPQKLWIRGVHTIESEYLDAHPDSGYFTEILPLKEFPDYIDYLPRGGISRKIGVMAYLPDKTDSAEVFIAVSREEYAAFVSDTIKAAAEKIRIIIEGSAYKAFSMHPILSV